jgi:hypothetical protein
LFFYYFVVYCFAVVSFPLPHPVVPILPTVSAIDIIVVVCRLLSSSLSWTLASSSLSSPS